MCPQSLSNQRVRDNQKDCLSSSLLKEEIEKKCPNFIPLVFRRQSRRWKRKRLENGDRIV
jgi:hypothetical protein